MIGDGQGRVRICDFVFNYCLTFSVARSHSHNDLWFLRGDNVRRNMEFHPSIRCRIGAKCTLGF